MGSKRRTRETDGGDWFHELVGDLFGLTPRRARVYKKQAFRIAKVAGLMFATAIVVPIFMISMGLLLGPKGYEGLVATPLTVLSAWALILYFGLRRTATKKELVQAKLSELPGKVETLLEGNRRALPQSAIAPLERILDQLDELEPALMTVSHETPATGKVRRLLADDLTDLLDHYRRLPPRLRKKALPGGQSPESQVTAGMETIARELTRMQDEMAGDDLYSLATKQRYLELKYGEGKD